MKQIERWDYIELRLKAKNSDHPYQKKVQGLFEHAQESVTVDGFYDGDDVYKVRFMPRFTGVYQYTISGDDMPTQTGSFEVVKATGNNHGPVHVANQYHFAYEDGTPHYSMGTTCYAWMHQNENLQLETLKTLQTAGFNKIRCCIFPKHYDYNLAEPLTYPFLRGHKEGLDEAQVKKAIMMPPVENPDMNFDFFSYNVKHFQRIDERLKQLRDLNIEADLILFHPYDRWGNNKMTAAADDAYLKYVVARFAAYRNVWWSLANEYDLMPQKTTADWERFASIIVQHDPYGHLRSIHNCIPFYDHSRPWITHCSLQRQDLYRHVEYTDEYRERWQKPIVWDEIAYEGNINHGWGNISPMELTRRFWEACLRGGYAGHGETYMHKDNILWWSHGGQLHGQSAPRIQFLHRILKQTPGPGLKRLPGNFDELVAGTDTMMDDGYRLYYYGFGRPSFREFYFDEDTRYEVEVIDTWEMTITFRGIHHGHFKVELPGKEYMAIRIKKVD